MSDNDVLRPHSTSGRGVLIPLACNLLLVLAGYTICRLEFLVENLSRFSSMSAAEGWMAFVGGLRFDWSAICLTNSLFVVLFIFSPFFRRGLYTKSVKTLFVLVNGLCIAANLIDSVYFEYIKRRSTASVFREFQGDDLSGIFLIEAFRHWYLLLAFLLMVVLLWRLYSFPGEEKARWPLWRRVTKSFLLLLLAAGILVGGIRGGFDPELRPINNKDAKEYIANPMQSALVLNTPFSMLRTIGKKAFPDVAYFPASELDDYYSPLHAECPQNAARPNVVIIILESFASEYSALLNPYSGGRGYMPFLDSLMLRSRIYRNSFANGNSSIDGQASVLASIPMMVESFFTSHAALNDINGIASELKRLGYSTAFFHGADNGSLSIDGFTHSVGFESFYGRTEYGNDADWDHHWGIWDEPFMQFFAARLDEMPRPFCAGLFTLTSHHPFQIPAKYKETFRDGPLEIHKTIRYTDMALRKFFDRAKMQPWYSNTLFVLTGDHTNMTEYPFYRTTLGAYQVPIVFFHPTDTLFQGGMREGIAQHIDIMPTILSYTGCKRPYVAFGNDLLSTPAEQTFALEYAGGVYQIIKGDYLLLFDGEAVTALYRYADDPLLEHNLAANPTLSGVAGELAVQLKAFIQSYMHRMNKNELVWKE